MKFPGKLNARLLQRLQDNALRELGKTLNGVDFASNDYIGFAKSQSIFDDTHQYLIDKCLMQNGATGSRLLSGNHTVYEAAEQQIARFHEAETALVFNSGYDANLGFFSAVPQKGDFIFYDELIHASIRDGIRLSNAKSYKFGHNDFEQLEKLILKFNTSTAVIYIVTESVFSMDGDCPDWSGLIAVSEKYNGLLVIDEAHALGVFGTNGEGLLQELQLQSKVFARIITFGKGLGCHGAAILGSQQLRDYLVNFARSFIFTTGLSPHAVANIFIAYEHLEKDRQAIHQLRENIAHFNRQKNLLSLKPLFVRSKSAIQCAIIPGNDKVKTIAAQLQQNGFEVKAILSPTVPEGQERLRICLHSYNTESQINLLLQLLANFITQ